jgi:hypothetical protein
MSAKLLLASVGIAIALFGCSSHKNGDGAAGSSGAAGSAGATAGAAGGAAGSAGAAGATAGSAGGTAGSAGGTAGAAGGVGAAGMGGVGAAGMGGVGGADESVLERGKRPSRDGHYVQPRLTTAAATTMKVDTTFETAAVYTGTMYASPLYLEKGPNGKGIFLAATTNNEIKAYDDAGTPAWTRGFGAFTAGTTFTPKGVMSTPVIDPAAGPDGFATIYACAPAGATAGGKFDHYELHAISARDGLERAGWPAKLDGTIVAKNDGLNRAFVPANHGQRPALSLVGGVVYVGFGGPLGDYSTYQGWVIAVDTKNPATLGAWSTRLPGGAIWTPGGFASDGDGVIITTGNYFLGGPKAPATYGDSESILRISGAPGALTRKDGYYPTRFKQMDVDDQDFGSSSVMLLNVPGATPSKVGVTVSKDAHLYVVDLAKLGNADGGGELVDLPLTPSNHSARVSPVAYTTATGIHVAVTVDRGAYTGCPGTAPDPGMAILEGFTVSATNPIKVTQSWCTTIGGPTMADNATIKNRSASPLVTTTDGKANPIVWVAGSASQATSGTTANLLYGVDGETGVVLYHGGNCAGIRQWTTPIAVKGHIVVGGDGHLCSWSPQ